MSRLRKIVVWTAVAFAALVVLFTFEADQTPGVLEFNALVAGWIFFLNRASRQIEVRLDMVGSSIVYMIIAIIGAHFFLRWLYRELNKGDSSATRKWRWRWTFSGFTLVVLMFATGISAVGIANHTLWLVTSPQELYTGGGNEYGYRIKCASNLRQIGQAIEVIV